MAAAHLGRRVLYWSYRRLYLGTYFVISYIYKRYTHVKARVSVVLEEISFAVRTPCIPCSSNSLSSPDAI